MTLNISPVEDLAQRQPPVIPDTSIILNSTGFVWREFLVRLPEDFVADDLKDPGIWRLIQTGFKALVKHDRLYLVAWDESWAAEAIVASADGSKVVLAKPRIINFPERFEKLFEDEKFRVAWVGNGYCVVRKADGQRITSPVSSAAIAERDLVMQYPRSA